MPSALALGVWLLLAEPVAAAGEPAEPGLSETQEAAARRAGGETAEDASRTARARRAHWAPAVRGQAGMRQDERTRRGELRLAPLREDDAGLSHIWGITVTWDLAQIVYAREESQLALAHAHLARLRREAADKAAQLWIERRRTRISLAELPPGPRRLEVRLELLRLTGQLDALTGGLFRDSLEREEAACAAEEKR